MDKKRDKVCDYGEKIEEKEIKLSGTIRRGSKGRGGHIY